MAKIILNPTIERAKGKLGRLVFRMAHTGEMTLIKAADMSGVKWSKAQKEHRRRFKEAVAYARAAMAEPKERSRYEKRAAAQKKRPFDLAVSDFMKAERKM